MDAIHVNWSLPKTAHGAGEYHIEDFEILTTILSALMWCKNGGRIKLVADKVSIDYYKNIGIDIIWNEIEELSVPEWVNSDMFWAAGKLFALKKQKAPVVMIDTDFIVWDKISFNVSLDCSVIHFEDIYPDIYPQKDYFRLKSSYEWKDYNWQIKPANTAFAVFYSQELLDRYTDEAIDFMKNAYSVDDALCYMVFCEQRLLPMIADDMNLNIRELCGVDELFGDKNKKYTHIWGMKQQMRDDELMRYDFCKRCIYRILKDFPEISGLITNINVLKKYL